MELTFPYEFVLVLSIKSGEETRETLFNKFKSFIEANANLVNIENWGKKRLAYEINKETEGDYTLFEFTSDAKFPIELDRVTKITDGVLRSMIVRKEVKKEVKTKKEEAKNA